MEAPEPTNHGGGRQLWWRDTTPIVKAKSQVSLSSVGGGGSTQEAPSVYINMFAQVCLQIS